MFVFTLDPALVIQLVLTVVMPIAVGLVTSRTTAGSTKTWLLAGLTLLTSLVTQLGSAVANHVPYDLGLGLLATIPAFAISVAMYYGLWKPTGVGEAVQDVEETTLVR